MENRINLLDGSQKKLTDAFADRSKFVAYRASTVFPVLLGSSTDVIVAMLNYWKIKSGILNIVCNIRIYQENGALVHLSHHKIQSDHFHISLQSLVGKTDFIGMAEVEILSTENMRFPFPAIMTFYKSGEVYSAVHSAGRIKNPDEAYIPSHSCETNWSCKFTGDITPFFHVFNGPRQDSVPEIRAQLFDPKNKLLEDRTFCPEIRAPFSSKIFFAEDIFSTNDVPIDSFIKVTLPNAEFFPRLVVGNYHKSIKFLEATHSFKEIDFEDFCPDLRPEKSLLSFMGILQPEELKVELVSFPTNSPSLSPVKSEIRRTSNGVLEKTNEIIAWDAGVKADRIFRYRLGPSDRAITLDFKEGKVPSRLNASYCYRVKNASGVFSTDIASGANFNGYPPKHSQWGHGIIGNSYETVIMFHNFSHHPDTTQKAQGTLTVYSDKFAPLNYDLVIMPEGISFVYLKKAFALADFPRENTIVSWFIKFDAPTVFSYWVSYANDGRICGEHGF